MRLRQWTGILIATMAFSTPALAKSSDIIDGQELYRINCAQCHAEDGSASEYGKSLQPFPARNHRAMAPLVGRDELRRIIAYGIAGTEMTPKKYDLDGLEIEAVIDYIKTFEYTPDLVNGKKRFEEICSKCHGMDGRANTGMGAKDLVYTKLDLMGIAYTMRYGRHGTKMTSKRHQMSNEAIADVANYVYSLRYMSNPANGSKLYSQYCTKCHTTPAQIKLIGNAARKQTVSDLSDRLLDLRIRHGRHVDRAGKEIGKLSADDVQDIIAYMRKSFK